MPAGEARKRSQQARSLAERQLKGYCRSRLGNSNKPLQSRAAGRWKKRSKHCSIWRKSILAPYHENDPAHGRVRGVMESTGARSKTQVFPFALTEMGRRHRLNERWAEDDVGLHAKGWANALPRNRIRACYFRPDSRLRGVLRADSHVPCLYLFPNTPSRSRCLR